MHVIRKLEEIPFLSNPAVSIGSFDGIHLGHRRVLTELKKQAKQNDGVSVVITFDPHPQRVLHPEKDLFLINTLEEKIQLISEEHIDYLIIIPFTFEFSQISFIDFFQKFLIDCLHVKTLVFGPHHSIGKDRAGDLKQMRKVANQNDIRIVMVSELRIAGEGVRSNKIRKLLNNGEQEKANKMLK
jgi:riboflavin kinase/FMN adenylyltransferase